MSDQQLLISSLIEHSGKYHGKTEIVDCDPELKAKSAKIAMIFSRANTVLSLPMLLSMVAAQNLY